MFWIFFIFTILTTFDNLWTILESLKILKKRLAFERLITILTIENLNA